MSKAPTPAQAKVLALLLQGWAMGWSTSLFVGLSCWLQQDGLGMGGPVERVSPRTAHAMMDRKWLRVKKPGFPTCEYELARAGRAAAEQLQVTYERVNVPTDNG